MSNQKLNHEEAAAANRTAVRRLYDECFNQGRLEVADQLVAPRFAITGPGGAGGGGALGPEAFKANARQLLAGFPDIQFTIHDLVAERDRVAVYWTWEGKHSGAFATIAPTGRKVRQEGMVLYHFEEGKAAQARAFFDRLNVMQQLGAAAPLPDSRPAGAAAQGRPSL